jgi:hypothetical protein
MYTFSITFRRSRGLNYDHRVRGKIATVRLQMWIWGGDVRWQGQPVPPGPYDKWSRWAAERTRHRGK